MREAVPVPKHLQGDVRTEWPQVSRRSHILRVFSLALFVLSLESNGVLTNPIESDFSSGASLLLIGWLGLVVGVFAWLANPLLLLAWLTMGRRDALVLSGLCSFHALVLALTLLISDTIPEATEMDYHLLEIVSLGQAYWLWLSSMLVALLAVIWEGVSSPPRASMIQDGERVVPDCNQ